MHGRDRHGARKGTRISHISHIRSEGSLSPSLRWLPWCNSLTLSSALSRRDLLTWHYLPPDLLLSAWSRMAVYLQRRYQLLHGSLYIRDARNISRLTKGQTTFTVDSLAVAWRSWGTMLPSFPALARETPRGYEHTLKQIFRLISLLTSMLTFSMTLQSNKSACSWIAGSIRKRRPLLMCSSW